MVPKAIVTLLCGVGLYASLFMLAKTLRAQRGTLPEPSVVQSPRARLFGGIPNALVGTLYYAVLAVAIWFAGTAMAALALAAAVGLAALTSAYLAYSLACVTRRACPYCWTAHIVNWALVPICTWALRDIVFARLIR
jgi:uncharacterized membrane protein